MISRGRFLQNFWGSFPDYLATASVSSTILLVCTGPRPNTFHASIITVKFVLRATIICYNCMENIRKVKKKTYILRRGLSDECSLLNTSTRYCSFLVFQVMMYIVHPTTAFIAGVTNPSSSLATLTASSLL